MAGRRDDPFVQVSASLADLVGRAFVDAAIAGRCRLTGEEPGDLSDLALGPVDFYPTDHHELVLDAVAGVGSGDPLPALASSARGASTRGFNAATRTAAAPVSTLGCVRIGEDGRTYLTTKSEHYHVPLGHEFPGFALLDVARTLGVSNATHNNTRGHITRLLEERLVRLANDLDPFGDDDLGPILSNEDPRVINRVLNLQTGSLAGEAAFKMCMGRFYLSQEGARPPEYAGKTPVFMVIADDDGKPCGNYHGTTAFVQALRGLWPGLSAKMEELGLMKVCAIRPNRVEDLEAAFARYEGGETKIAAFFHEIIMMNYGARALTPEFLRRAYELCAAHDVPTVCDEIQSCLWAPGVLLYREIGLKPTFVVLGKGFGNGEYAASRLLFSAAMDNLCQFGALVTNGQEELASLTYLVSLKWATANEARLRETGDAYEARLRALVTEYPSTLAGVEGSRHMSALRFHNLAGAQAFVARTEALGIDLTVQAYKADCPPIVLTKLPLIADEAIMDRFIELLRTALGKKG
ncbi:MAG: aminotransferase class III-fold pyridoxal phosphate-dependent enzyme [Armatimonadetes bacterium]|nr:aminotransferase class III-fold pyridoxal phosphate-dependent enzyme [Armatimonadota bacterium]